MPEETVIRMDDNVKNDNSPDSEEPPRHQAGFDFAAGPNEALFFAPQRYISLGIMSFMGLSTAVMLIMTPYFLTLGIIFLNILTSTIVFYPEPMGHFIHWIFQCIVLMCFPLMLLGNYIDIMANKEQYRFDVRVEGGNPDKFFTWVHVYTWVMMFPALINATLVLRMTIFAFQNRGG